MCFAWAEPALFCCTGKKALTGTGIKVLGWINWPGIRQRMFCKSVPAGENYTVWSPPASMPLCSPESSFVFSCVFVAECQGEESLLGLWAPMQVTVPRGGSGHQIMSGQKQDVWLHCPLTGLCVWRGREVFLQFAGTDFQNNRLI